MALPKQSGTRRSSPGARPQRTHLPTSLGVEGDLEAGLPVKGTVVVGGCPRNLEHQWGCQEM